MKHFLTMLLIATCLVSQSQDIKHQDVNYNVGIQSFGFRNFDLEHTLNACNKMGITHVEFFSKHISEDGDVKEYKRLLKKYGITASGFFVNKSSDNYEGNKVHFEFAQKMGYRIIMIGQLFKNAQESLNKLCEEYPDIRIAVHNHGPEDPQGAMAEMDALLEGFHQHVGVCIDSGHVMRSHEDPVKWVRNFKGRVYGVHMKEYHGQEPLSEKNKLDLKGFINELRVAGFPNYGTFTVEYEGTPDNPVENIEASVKYVHKVYNSIYK